MNPATVAKKKESPIARKKESEGGETESGKAYEEKGKKNVLSEEEGNRKMNLPSKKKGLQLIHASRQKKKMTNRAKKRKIEIDSLKGKEDRLFVTKKGEKKGFQYGRKKKGLMRWEQFRKRRK